MNVPDLIDNYKHCQHRFVINGKDYWYFAKPYREYTLMDRIYHAYLILIGKSTAVYFYEDINKMKV